MMTEKHSAWCSLYSICATPRGEFHGKPFFLLPWQRKIIEDVFGTVRDDDPTRRQYKTAYIEIPKKQGKSELGAALITAVTAAEEADASEEEEKPKKSPQRRKKKKEAQTDEQNDDAWKSV